MKAPLSGVRVLDLSRLLPGPYATWMLAQMGAEVLDVDDPTTQDMLKSFPPYDAQGRSLAYEALHHGKQRIELNLRTAEGIARARRLASECDVLVETFRPGVLRELGPEALLQENPRLIYCSLTGYGQTGPLAARAGHDITYLARSGLASVTGAKDGTLALPGFQLADIGAGSLMVVVAVLGALRQRTLTGVGQHLDVSMTDGAATFMPVQAVEALAAGRNPRPGRDVLSGGLPQYRYYRCQDGRWLAVGALEPKFWQRMCQGLGMALPYPIPTMGEYADVAAALEAKFLEKSRDEWVAQLAPFDCCVEPVLELSEALTQENARARGLVHDGRMQFPIRFQPPEPAPITIEALGEDRTWSTGLLRDLWSDVLIARRGALVNAAELPGFVATRGNQRIGLVTFDIRDGECEIVTINSLAPGTGVGSTLISTVLHNARAAACRRVYLITTNDNLRALRFYQRHGFQLSALYRNALDESRSLKPSIPLIGMDGIALRDELELEYLV